MNIWIFILGGIFVGLLVGVGLNFFRKTKSAEDFILAGSKVGTLAGMLTFAAAMFSTFTFMGMPDFFRTHGVGAWIFLAVSDAIMFFFVLWFGQHLRKRAHENNYQGMAGFLATVYKSWWAGIVYLFGIFCFLIPYVAIQIRGIAIFFNAEFPDVLPMWGWSVGMVCFMFLYGATGGLRGIVYSNAIQATILLVAIWVIAIGCINAFGSPAGMFKQVRQVEPALLSTPGPEGLFTYQFLVASLLMILMFPVTQPQIVTRLVIVRSQKTVRHMALALSIFTFLLLLATMPIGFYGAVKYAGVPARDFMGTVLIENPVDIIAAFVMVGLLAAATSTAEAQIFALGSELRSLLVLRGHFSINYTRILLFGFSIAALIFSIVSSDQLVLLARVSFAGTAITGPMILAAIFSRQKPHKTLILLTLIGLVVFLLSLLGVIPEKVLAIRMDLFLLILLSLSAVLLGIWQGKKQDSS